MCLVESVLVTTLSQYLYYVLLFLQYLKCYTAILILYCCLYTDIGHFNKIKLIAGSRELSLENSLVDSGVEKNSRVALVVTTHGGHLLKFNDVHAFYNILNNTYHWH